ncbi:MAG: hypothetical protein AAF551_06065, partial [Bacteroidota bacterium]
EQFIRLHLPLTSDLEEKILERCEEVSEYNRRGVHWRKWVNISGVNDLAYDSTFDYRQNAKHILNCVLQNTVIMVDSTSYTDLRYYFSSINDPTDYAVFMTVLDASMIARGSHELIIKSSLDSMDITIPFWRD